MKESIKPGAGRKRKSVARGTGLPASLKAVHLNAAGIDVGSAEHYVAVPEDRDPAAHRFECFTADLHRLADWLEQCGVDTVVMESTGVYWIPLFQILETRGFEVKLVDAHHVKNLPRRKKRHPGLPVAPAGLHTFGLLSGSFRPDDETCVLRSYIRQRDTLIRDAAAHVQRMQKALTQMNIQLHKVISDITGVSGMRIIRSILAGERDPQLLAAMRDHRVRAPPSASPNPSRATTDPSTSSHLSNASRSMTPTAA